MAKASKAPDPVIDMRRTAPLFALASDPTRLAILGILAKGEQCVGDLCTLLGLAQPAVSHHLALLRVAGVISPRREGKKNFYDLEEPGRTLHRAALALSIS